MRRDEIQQIKTISAGSLKEFDKLYNSTARELGEAVTKVDDLGETVSRFHYTVTEEQVESVGDEFMQHGAYCHCSDCPFLEIGHDARRKTFPCMYAKYGETRVDAPACEMFYKEAIRRMRERCE